ncbi:MAG: phosphate ABC transporter permease PstA [Clostridiales bacterium]|nr:phosphate ABC transporter permease PstA [Clostridiales bacterium]
MSSSKRRKDIAYYGVIAALSVFTLFCLIVIIVYITSNGLPHITWEFLTERPRSMGKEGGIFPIIVATLYATAIALVIACPIGIGAAVFFKEYSKGGRFIQIVRIFTEVLAGIPSIVFGLFGFAFFVVFLGLGWSVLSGGLTLFMMILPTIVRSTEESLETVPMSYREGSLSVGATRWQTTVKVVLPCCVKGIVTGVILGVGRAVGETAAVMLTMGGALRLPLSPFDAGRTMSMHMFVLTSEGLSMEKTFATAALLIIIILIINSAANLIGRKVGAINSA